MEEPGGLQSMESQRVRHDWATSFSVTLKNIFFFLPCHETCEILVPWPGFELGPPVVDVWSPNHWTTREVPEDHFVFTPLLPLICVLLHPYLSSTCSWPRSLLLEVAYRPAVTSEQASDPSSHCTGPCWHQQGWWLRTCWPLLELVLPKPFWSACLVHRPLLLLSHSPFFLTVAIHQTQSQLLCCLKNCLDRRDSWILPSR